MKRFVERIIGTVPNVRWLAAGITVVTVACAFLAHLVAREDFPLGRIESRLDGGGPSAPSAGNESLAESSPG